MNSADIVLICNQFGQSNPFADIDGDGAVDLADIAPARERIGSELSRATFKTVLFGFEREDGFPLSRE